MLAGDGVHMIIGKNRAGSSILAISVAIALSLTIAAPSFAEDEAVSAQQASGPSTWGIDAGGLETDPDVHYGSLPNGMKYAIQKNPAYSGAAVRFMLDVGKIDEEDSERGYAHFVEHMAFNGSKRIAEGDLVKKLTRLGLAFGADTNAETGVDYTSYKLDLPRTDAETINAALLMMRELASELTLTPQAVERERGVINAEEATINSPIRRRVIDWLTLAMPETRVGSRVSNGDGSAINAASSTSLRSFYENHYRPDRATLVIVGDVDRNDIEQKIKANFSDWQAAGPARARYRPSILATRPISAGNFVDASGAGVVELQRVVPFVAPVNGLADQEFQMNQALAMIALNARLAKLTSIPDSPIVQAQPLQQSLFRLVNSVGVYANGKGDSWPATLGLLEQEMRRAAEHGFTPTEFGTALSAIETFVQNAVSQKLSRGNGFIADALTQASLAKAVVLSPEQIVALLEKIKPSLSAASVSAAFGKMWGDGPNVVHVTTRQPVADAKTAIAASLSQSRSIAVAPNVDNAAKAFAYSNFGQPGKIVSDRWLDKYGMRTVKFANGVMLNLVPNRFEQGSINFSLRVDGGYASLPANKPGLALMLEVATPNAGFGAHSVDEVRQFVSGKAVTLGLANDGKAFFSSGVISKTDLATQLNLFAATLSDFGYRPETEAYWANLAPAIQSNIATNPIGVYQTAAPYILSSNDARFGFDDPAVLLSRNITELKESLDTSLKSAPTEIALVGDFDEEEAINFVANTVGALPKRTPKTKLSPKIDRQVFPADRTPRRLFHDGQPDQGLIAVHWPTTDDSDLRTWVTLEVLSAAFNLELLDSVREQLGAVYTPNVAATASSDFKGFGYLTALSPAAPEKIEIVRESMLAIAQKLRASPISEDLLFRARKPLQDIFDRDVVTNAAMIGPVAVAQSEPHRVPRRFARADVLAAVTAKDVQKMALRYLSDADALEILVLPRPANAGE
jgi:zinc protease